MHGPSDRGPDEVPLKDSENVSALGRLKLVHHTPGKILCIDEHHFIEMLTLRHVRSLRSELVYAFNIYTSLREERLHEEDIRTVVADSVDFIGEAVTGLRAFVMLLAPLGPIGEDSAERSVNLSRFLHRLERARIRPTLRHFWAAGQLIQIHRVITTLLSVAITWLAWNIHKVLPAILFIAVMAGLIWPEAAALVSKTMSGALRRLRSLTDLVFGRPLPERHVCVA